MIKDLVLKSRSYRGYDNNVKISDKDLLEIVDCARLSPSSVNVQPLKYYLSNEEKEVLEILEKTYWAKGLPGITLPKENFGPTAFIIILQDKDIDSNLSRFLKDVGIVAQTMLLAATEMGYGGCMIGNFQPEVIKELLGLSDNLEPILVVALGKPAETIKLVDVINNNTKYYRDDNDVHYVPKRKLEDIILKRGEK
jgi:nitroreductase